MRRSLATGRGWLALVLAVTLLARLAVPAGFMPAVVQGSTLLRLCPGAGDIAPAMATMAGHHHQSHGEDHDKVEAPCAFAGLGLAMTGPVGPALIVAALLFAFVQALLVAAPFPPASTPHLRPPLRAPPLSA